MSTSARALRRRLAGAWVTTRDQARNEPDRGDVPGWVMVTLMTAGLVIGIWALAGNQLEQVFTEAMSRVLNF